MGEIDKTSASKHDLIIEAAVAEFQENGFALASMDRVSSRAGVSKRTVYKYFESKEKLFQSIVKKLWISFADGVNISYRPGADIREQLTALGEAEGRLLTSHEVMMLARLVVSEVIRSPELAGELQEKVDFKAAFEGLLRGAVEDGQLAIDDPGEAADEFLGLLKAKAFWPVIFGAPVLQSTEMNRIVESSVEMMMCRYQRPPEAQPIVRSRQRPAEEK